MTGPEHYREAEKYLAVLDTEKDPQAWAAAVGRGEIAVGMLAGLVHATLALAAATAQSAVPAESRDYDEWREAAGTYSVSPTAG
jgi:hypothetical protein